MKLLDTLARLLDGVMYAVNRKRKKDAANNAANAVANGGSVYKSKKSLSDLADKPKRDSAK